jgi:hypothetical protein
VAQEWWGNFDKMLLITSTSKMKKRATQYQAAKIHLKLIMYLARLYHTLRPLRLQQYWYRAWHPLKRLFYRPAKAPGSVIGTALNHIAIKLFKLPVTDFVQPAQHAFTMLNVNHVFPGQINWDIRDHGLLWCYHLNYFGWLGDECVDVAQRIKLLCSYPWAERAKRKTGLESYPASLRGVAIIRFLLQYPVADKAMLAGLFEDYSRLRHFPEYHLQANHLWMNGCALYLGGLFFKDAGFYQRGKKILARALDEQVLADGGHIEGSPMYHSLLLTALFQCIEIDAAIGTFGDAAFRHTMREAASRMLGWLQQVTFRNGDWPLVSDSTPDMTPSPALLLAYASALGIAPTEIPLKESGYRMLRNDRLEVFADVGSIQPPWQPGHAHSDELTFCLNVDGRPVIVDRGIHTYEAGQGRSVERSTAAHNVVSVPGRNASDVWKSFRTGKKARVAVLTDTPVYLAATHDGYLFPCTRKFYLSERGLILEDFVETNSEPDLYLHLHFAPDIFLKKCSDTRYLAQNLLIEVSNSFSIAVECYACCLGFNKTVSAQLLKIKIGCHTITSLEISN